MASRLEQHLAWTETRVGHLLTWIARPVEGWERSTLTKLLLDRLAEISDLEDEAHF